MCDCGCACGRKKWCAGACAAHYQNVCDVRAGAAENPRTLKVCIFDNMIKILLSSMLQSVRPKNK